VAQGWECANNKVWKRESNKRKLWGNTLIEKELGRVGGFKWVGQGVGRRDTASTEGCVVFQVGAAEEDPDCRRVEREGRTRSAL